MQSEIHNGSDPSDRAAALSSEEMEEARGVLRLTGQAEDEEGRLRDDAGTMPNGDPSAVMLWGADESAE